jgi:hypothetical protein
MCLDKKKPIKSKTYSKEEILSMFKTAKKNKTVYKVFLTYIRGNFIHLSAPYQNYRYYLGQKYKSSITVGEDNEYNASIQVHRGIHAFVSSKRSLRHFRSSLDSKYVLLPCTIPVGAKYLVGYDNEIVTDILILPDHFIYQGEEYNINY